MGNKVTVKQIQRLDKRAIHGLGIPSVVLMENAGRLTAEVILKTLKKHRHPFACIVCGLGNNAGDGFVVARHLLNRDVWTKVYLIGSAQKLKEDGRLNYKIYKKLKGTVKSLKRADQFFLKDLKRATVVVDAIFGVGLNRAVGAPFKGIIEAINASKRFVVAVDVPSGLDGTTGKIYGVCVKAKVTVTFTSLKSGFLKNQGPGRCGRIEVVDIGIPKQLQR